MQQQRSTAITSGVVPLVESHNLQTKSNTANGQTGQTQFGPEEDLPPPGGKYKSIERNWRDLYLFAGIPSQQARDNVTVWKRAIAAAADLLRSKVDYPFPTYLAGLGKLGNVLWVRTGSVVPTIQLHLLFGEGSGPLGSRVYSRFGNDLQASPRLSLPLSQPCPSWKIRNFPLQILASAGAKRFTALRVPTLQPACFPQSRGLSVISDISAREVNPIRQRATLKP